MPQAFWEYFNHIQTEDLVIMVSLIYPCDPRQIIVTEARDSCSLVLVKVSYVGRDTVQEHDRVSTSTTEPIWGYLLPQIPGLELCLTGQSAGPLFNVGRTNTLWTVHSDGMDCLCSEGSLGNKAVFRLSDVSTAAGYLTNKQPRLGGLTFCYALGSTSFEWSGQSVCHILL